jgi:hypothetical protein
MWQSFFGKALTFGWLLLVIALAIRFSSDFAAWFLSNIGEAKSWTALLLLFSVLHFTNPGVTRLVQGALQSASRSSAIHAGGRVENAFFLGRPPSSMPDAPPRLPLTSQDRSLAAEISWVKSKSRLLNAKN